MAQDLAQRLRGHWRRTLAGGERGQRALLRLPRVLANEDEARLPHCAPWCLGPSSFEHLLIALNDIARPVNLATALTPHFEMHPCIGLTLDTPWRHDIDNATNLLDHYAIPASIFVTSTPLEDTGLWRVLIGDGLWRRHLPERIRDALGDTGLPLPPMPPKHPDNAYSRALLNYFLQLEHADSRRLSEIGEHLLDILDHSLQPIDPFSARRLESGGLCRFGAGGLRFDGQDDNLLRQQMRRSRKTLAQLCREPLTAITCTGKPPSLTAQQVLQRCGVTTALLDTGGWLTRHSDTLVLPRIPLSQPIAQSPGRLFDYLFGYR
ncbi:polysaccharide deacetylase family protein [Halomonas sp. GXIMD04776]|uniref:polysaccharide deacetylase family protein n=1 Tax=Halomonas sp. GXIMD04776 TaxID=3415605 RepID=UPI003C93825E